LARPVNKQNALTFDWPLLLLVGILCAVGFVNLRSAAAVEGSSHHLTQLVWFALGTVTAGIIALQDYRIAERWAYVLYGLSTLLLVLVLFFGINLNGSYRWFDLGAFHLQPSEIAKVGTILATARYFHDHEKAEAHGIRDLLVPIALVAVPFVLILLQPDLGTGLVVIFIFATMAMMERVRMATLASLFAAVLAAIPLMWLFVLHDYQKERVMAFLNPGENVHDEAWQVTQARIAIGSGRIVGKGYMQGTQVQNGFVPEHETDFVFALTGEQFGFVGSVVLIGLYLLLVLWCLRIARHGRDRFAVLTAVGVAAFLFWHVVINLSMVTGLLPVVGLWLPLASYGGSATMTVFIALGLLMSISLRRHVF
jgi:rod shape determining protein RodA